VQAFSSASARLTVRYRTTRSLKEALARSNKIVEKLSATRQQVEIPEQLKHYGDRRRFLAVQAAAATTESISIDFADLAPLIQRGELVEMKPLGTDYILYGVGYSVSGEPFAHYDSARKQDIRWPQPKKALLKNCSERQMQSRKAQPSLRRSRPTGASSQA